MKTDTIMSDEQLEALTQRVWVEAQDRILEQVKYAIQNELSDRARSRARVLIVNEVDAIIKPKIEAMKVEMEERAKRLADSILPKVDEAMKIGLENAIRGISEHTIRQILSSHEYHVRDAMLKELSK